MESRIAIRSYPVCSLGTTKWPEKAEKHGRSERDRNLKVDSIRNAVLGCGYAGGREGFA